MPGRSCANRVMPWQSVICSKPRTANYGSVNTSALNLPSGCSPNRSTRPNPRKASPNRHPSPPPIRRSFMREPRLGDDIDDFCVRCKRVTNHSIVSVVNAEPAKVRCRTCHSDHDFRHEQAPPPKVDPRKAALFNEVLKKVNPDAAPVGDDADPVDEVAVPIELGDTEEAEAADPPVEEAPPPPPKVKAKGRG